ncbi:MAG: hypothetical protein M1814_000367 [Vezdaea aestivalis]|nr:MAG: hypothetical protein M1814_000367 [Vezdaea aestivalis]
MALAPEDQLLPTLIGTPPPSPETADQTVDIESGSFLHSLPSLSNFRRCLNTIAQVIARLIKRILDVAARLRGNTKLQPLVAPPQPPVRSPPPHVGQPIVRSIYPFVRLGGIQGFGPRPVLRLPYPFAIGYPDLREIGNARNARETRSIRFVNRTKYLISARAPMADATNHPITSADRRQYAKFAHLTRYPVTTAIARIEPRDIFPPRSKFTDGFFNNFLPDKVGIPSGWRHQPRPGITDTLPAEREQFGLLEGDSVKFRLDQDSTLPVFNLRAKLRVHRDLATLLSLVARKKLEVVRILLESPYIQELALPEHNISDIARRVIYFKNPTLLPNGALNDCDRGQLIKCLRQNYSPDRGRKGREGWPAHAMPTEVFWNIARFLSRDSVEAMRLVCKEWDTKTVGVLFNQVVLPFRYEIYGLMTTSPHQAAQKLGDLAGRALSDLLAQASALGYGPSRSTENSTDHLGIKVFQGFGSHIDKFAMTFEINEDNLFNAPWKDCAKTHESFWGSYRWPKSDYVRHALCESMENIADETKSMGQAFSHLRRVRHLGLSMDNGTGWIRGPDISARQAHFEVKPKVFGKTFDKQSAKMLDQMKAWHAAKGIPNREFPWIYRFNPNLTDHSSIMAYLDDDSDSEVAGHRSPGSAKKKTPRPPPTGRPRMPGNFDKAQVEWLLETGWAQQAFIQSWVISIIDNPNSFSRIETVDIARLPAGFLPFISRTDFWSSFTCLKSVSIHVLPTWRIVAKTVDMSAVNIHRYPSNSVTPFFDLLKEYIAPIKTLKQLSIGWASGGELTPGMLGRNKHLMPAPLCRNPWSMLQTHTYPHIIWFPNLEELKLVNCWVTPQALLLAGSNGPCPSLKKLILESISLTAQPARRLIDINGDETTSVPANGDGLKTIEEPILWSNILDEMSDMLQPEYRHLATCVPGGWVDVLEGLSPGPTCASQLFEQNISFRPRRHYTNFALQELVLRSCGYAKLHRMTNWRQPHTDIVYFSGCEIGADAFLYLKDRRTDLGKVMMKTSDPLLGLISQATDLEEAHTLDSVFGVKEGWPDMTSVEAYEDAFEFLEDGQYPGGVGRYSGIIKKSTDLMNLS